MSFMKSCQGLASVLSALMVVSLFGCGTDAPPEENAEANNADMGEVQGCVHSCLLDDTLCKSDYYYLKCEVQADGCRDYSRQAVRCATGEICNIQTSKCEPDSSVEPRECVSNCEGGDPPRCNAEGEVETCELRDGMECFTYEVSSSCGDGEVCTDGVCGEPACPEPCTLNDTQCEGDQVQVCQEINGCLVFGVAEDCKDGFVCQNNSCEAQLTCEDRCVISSTNICSPSGVPRVCETLDTGCTGYVEKDACGDGFECDNGECVEADACPEDACLVGAKRCSFGDVVEICEVRQDGCPGFDQLESCGAGGYICDATSGSAQCVEPPMMSAPVVINEVFYNIPGADVDPTTMQSKSFIELRGQAGQSLAGWEVKLVNGSNGMPYQTLTLPSDAVIGSQGFALITTDAPVNYFRGLVFAGTSIYELIPASTTDDGFQNGPDNVELYDDQGSKIDAIGYGDFGMGDIFTGEGTSPGRVYENRSLGRIDGIDTDDNSADFVSFFPTPGLENEDLILNEVYVDQPGSDGQEDAMETFIEIVAPIRDSQWIDMELDQYNLRAINGFDGMDYVFNGTNAGVDFSNSLLNDLSRSTGEISTEGYVVVCNIQSTPSLINRCSVLFDGADFQNGPDSIVLEYDGRTIDALAYGTFSAMEQAFGEGAPFPVSSSDEGKSINRLDDGTYSLDDDDNSSDFYLTSPTPGARGS